MNVIIFDTVFERLININDYCISHFSNSSFCKKIENEMYQFIDVLEKGVYRPSSKEFTFVLKSNYILYCYYDNDAIYIVDLLSSKQRRELKG